MDQEICREYEIESNFEPQDILASFLTGFALQRIPKISLSLRKDDQVYDFEFYLTGFHFIDNDPVNGFELNTKEVFLNDKEIKNGHLYKLIFSLDENDSSHKHVIIEFH